MISKLKSLAAALAAVALVSAVTASFASAQAGLFTSDGPANLEGFQVLGGGNQFTAFGLTVECPNATAKAENVQSGAKTITVSAVNPSFACSVGGLKATVTTNGCDVLLHIGSTIGGGEGKYSGTGDLVCPVGKSAEMHVYASASNENVQTCKLLMPPQTGLTGGYAVNKAGGIEVGGPVKGIKVTKSGLCGSAETLEGQIDGSATVTGTNVEGSPTEIALSD